MMTLPRIRFCPIGLAVLCATATLGFVASEGFGIASVTQAGVPDTAPKSMVTEKGPVKMTLRVSPAQPRLSDLVTLEIYIEGREQVAIEPPAFGQAVGDFLVRDYSERKTDIQGKPIAAHSRLFQYQLEPAHSGKHLIRSLAIEFTDNRSESESQGQRLRIESDPIELTITSELDGQVPDLANLEPMLAPKSIALRRPWLLIMTIAALVSLFGMLLWATRAGKSKSIELPKRPPSEIAREQLDALLAEKLPSKGLLKEFYLRLTAIVREFIEGSTGIRAPEQTTEEFLHDPRLSTVFESDQSLRLKEFLEAADMVKYAGSQPSEDQVDTAIERAREFITLKLRGIEPEPVAAIEASSQAMEAESHE
jgi:hypothetical protein